MQTSGTIYGALRHHFYIGSLAMYVILPVRNFMRRVSIPKERMQYSQLLVEKRTVLQFPRGAHAVLWDFPHFGIPKLRIHSFSEAPRLSVQCLHWLAHPVQPSAVHYSQASFSQGYWPLLPTHLSVPLLPHGPCMTCEPATFLRCL